MLPRDVVQGRDRCPARKRQGPGVGGVHAAAGVGAIAMSVSTIVVALNAQLLRRLDLRPEHVEETLTARGGPAEKVASHA